MTLPVSPAPISLSQVAIELGGSGTATASLNDAGVRSLAGVPSGEISLSTLYGKSSVPTPSLPTSTYLGRYGNGGYTEYPEILLYQSGLLKVWSEDTHAIVSLNWASGSMPTGSNVAIRSRTAVTQKWLKLRFGYFNGSTNTPTEVELPLNTWYSIGYYPYASTGGPYGENGPYISIIGNPLYYSYNGYDQYVDISFDGGATYRTLYFMNYYE